MSMSRVGSEPACPAAPALLPRSDWTEAASAPRVWAPHPCSGGLGLTPPTVCSLRGWEFQS